MFRIHVYFTITLNSCSPLTTPTISAAVASYTSIRYTYTYVVCTFDHSELKQNSIRIILVVHHSTDYAVCDAHSLLDFFFPSPASLSLSPFQFMHWISGKITFPFFIIYLKLTAAKRIRVNAKSIFLLIEKRKKYIFFVRPSCQRRDC